MIYIFYGPDEYLKTEGAKNIIDKYVPQENRDFGLEVIDAHCDKCEETLDVLKRAEEGLFTASFFGDGKVVWLRDANFLPNVRSKALEAQDAKAASETFFTTLQTSPLPEGHHLVITADSFPQSSEFAKWMVKKGKCTVCGAEIRSGNVNKLGAERLASLLERVQLRMSPSVQQDFIQRVGADTRTLLSELEKLKTYLGANRDEVLTQDLNAVTATTFTGEPFDLINALQMRSPGQVAQVVARLRNIKDSAFPAAVITLNTLNDWCALSDALHRQWLVNGQWKIPSELIPARLAKMSGWALNKALEGVRRYSLTELRRARHYAVEMRFKLVDTTGQEPWAIVEPILLRIVARNSNAKR